MMGSNGNGNGQLTGLQRAFVDEWFKDFNGVRAAERAGYQGSYSTLGSVASENLKKPKILAEIERRFAAHGVTAEEVIATLAKQMRASPGDFMDEFGRVDLQAVKEHGRGVVKSVKIYKGNKVELNLECSQRAAELIGKTLALFVDRTKHEGEVQNVVTIEYVNDWRQNQVAESASGPDSGQE